MKATNNSWRYSTCKDNAKEKKKTTRKTGDALLFRGDTIEHWDVHITSEVFLTMSNGVGRKK